MKDFKQSYYILNCPWKRKLKLDSVKRFDNISYNNIIVFNFDLDYSVIKTSNTLNKNNTDSKLVISSINICMRYYGIITKLYPYNNIKIIIHTNNVKYYNILRPIINLMPDFAITIKQQDTKFLDQEKYKNIVYGSCSNLKSKIKNTECQSYYTIDGVLFVK